MSMVTLKSGGAALKVETVGAETMSYVAENGREYLWNGDPAVWASRCPILFPVCGAIIDGKVKFDGKEYPMQKHGFVRKAEFQVGKHGEDFVELVYSSNPQTLASYPYDFVLHVTHTAEVSGFTTTFLVENPSPSKRLPFCVGGHPGLACPIYAGDRFEDYILKFEKPESGEVLTVNSIGINGRDTIAALAGGDTLPLEHSYFDERDTLLFSGLNSRSVKLVNAKTGKGVGFRFPKFDALAVWTMPEKHGDYLCIEPWCGLPAIVGETGNFEDKPFVKWLEPGESFKAAYTVEVIE